LFLCLHICVWFADISKTGKQHYPAPITLGVPFSRAAANPLLSRYW
jgi:hypothetical protein